MKSIIFSVWLSSYLVLECSSVCIPDYGPNPKCRYVPAPPGKTPLCARPGSTYCEQPDNYPSELIYHLIQKWQFDHRSLIISEVKEEFHSYSYPPPSTVYGPPQQAQPTDDGYHYPTPVYVPKASQIYTGQGSYYLPPQINFTSNPGQNRDETFLTYKYTSNIPPYQSSSPIFSYTDVWRRNERIIRSLRRKRFLQIKNNLYSPFLNGTSLAPLSRKKRQDAANTRQLCRSRSSFIVPRAALNSKGNWMYVVNMPESSKQYTQMVKSETCVDTTCSGICGLPQGYVSKCEQKYVQKRLIALEGGGNNLYSDIFWFPSCCVCTISNS